MTTDRSHPSFATLLDFVEGRCDERDRQLVEELIANKDESVMGIIEWLRSFLLFGRSNPVPETPPLVRQRLRQAFERHHGRLSDPDEEQAELTFDSRTNKILVGVRGRVDDPEDAYQLAYSAPSADVLIDVTLLADDAVDLEGQVLTATSDDAVWESLVDHPSGTIRSVEGDRLGCFALDQVPTSATRLKVTNGRVSISIPLSFGSVTPDPSDPPDPR